MLKKFSSLLKAAMAKFSLSKENIRYTKYYKNISVKKGTLLLDNCSTAESLQLSEELCKNKAFKIYTVNSDCCGSSETVKPFSKKHLKLLASCEILISDCIYDFYIRKSEQSFYCFAKGSNDSDVQRSCIISTHIVCRESELENLRKTYMLDNIFNGTYILENHKTVDSRTYSNNKENVLIFTGALEKNGITTALKNLVNAVCEDKNYIPFFYEKAVKPNAACIEDLGGKDYISICGDMDMTLKEVLVLGLYYLNINIFPNTEKILDDIYKREIKRCFGEMKMDYAIHFTGYARNVLQLICRLNAKKLVWVHNNLFLEAKTKGNIHINTLKYGYNQCDKIVVVRDTMKDELTEYVEPAQRNKIQVVHNLNDADGIKSKALLPVEFQQDTYCNVSIEKLNKILENKDINKYINIARFSKEKGIDRLVTAFDKYRRAFDEKAYLIIIGGYGEEFEHILAMIQNSDGRVLMPNIIIIKSIMNPYPILKKCDLFVLSSHYEGLPMTIIEALILDVPVVSTDITGPKEFLEKGYGYLVEDSENGIIDGLKAFKNGSISDLAKFDVEKFNSDALNEFNNLFK